MTDDVSLDDAVERLEELVEEWRDDMVAAADREIQTKNRVLNRCAEDVETVIEELRENR